MTIDPHGHEVGSHVAHGPEGDIERDAKGSGVSVKTDAAAAAADAAGQIIGVFILEFGVVLHR